MFFNVLKVNQTYNYSEYRDRPSTYFDLVIGNDDDSYLEIGENCIVSAHNNFNARGKTQAAVQVSFYDIACFESDASNLLKRRRSSEKPFIGVAAFRHESLPNDPLDLYIPPSVSCEVWLSTNGYTHLLEQLKHKNFPTRLMLGFKNADSENDLGISYGWEPDGCHKIWKIDQTQRDNLIDLDEVWIEYQPFQRTSLDIAAAEVTQEVDQEVNKELLTNRDIDKLQPLGLPGIKTELVKIRGLLWVATIILGLIALTN